MGPPTVAAPVPPVGPSAPAAPVVPPGDSAQSSVSTRPSQSGSEDEDESVHMQRLSVMETELRLVQRDMVQVLQLPSLGETAGSSRQSFKHMTSSAASSTPVFPVLPLDLVCVERMNSIAESAKWSPYKKRELSYYRFPSADFAQFFTADSAKDKLAVDGGSSSAKNLFSDRLRGKLEDTLKKVDTASRLGLRASSFLLLLTEYLTLGCEEDSPVPADLFTAALHCLDHGLRTSLDQFSRISTLAVTARRANVLDALFLPSEGACKRLQALPLLGPDLFAGKFQESMEAEAKRLEATEKINGSSWQLVVIFGVALVIEGHAARVANLTPGVNSPSPAVAHAHRAPAIPGAGASDELGLWRPPIDGPVGGRLRHFSGSWARFTSDRWVLETVSRGYALEFTSTPRRTNVRPTPIPSDVSKRHTLEGELRSLLLKHAVHPVPVGAGQAGFMSTFFLVPKKGVDAWRPILNLRPLNRYIRPRVWTTSCTSLSLSLSVFPPPPGCSPFGGSDRHCGNG